MQEFNSVVKDFIDKNPRWAAYFKEGFTGTLQTHTYGRVDIFSELVPGYKDSKKEITRNRYAAGKLQLASKINKALPTLKEDNKARVDLFKEIALDMEKFLAIEGNENKFYVFDQLFKDGSQDQNHFLRSLIPLKFATVDPFTLKLNIKEEVTEEHTSPVVGIGRLIMEAIKTGNVEQVFKEIIEPSVAQGGLLRSIDENISKELKKDQAPEFYDIVLKLNKEGKNYTVERLMPTPYTLTVNVDVWSSNTDQKLQIIQIGLNDRIAFVKSLFGGSQEDFNRVVSQLNSFKTQKEAKKFIHKMVKPDYDWADKEDIEERFMDIIERKFL